MALVLGGLAAGCAGPGGPKAGAPPHHLERGFRNLDPDYRRPPASARWPFFFKRIWLTTFQPQTAALPRADNDGRALREHRVEPTVTWIGHSTLLVQLEGVNLLTDPQWSDRASPVSFAGPRRVTPPGVRFEDLPPIHVVLISHDHYDHLDVDTVTRLWAVHRPRFVTPLGFSAWFAGLGITEVDELDWWESRVIGGLTLTAVPAQHWGARTWWDTNRRLWSGWVVAGSGRRLYFAGDTGYWEGLKEIGRLGPFDLAAIPIGAYLPPVIMHASHTTPEEAVQLFQDLGARRLLAIHWGTFDLAEEPITDPPQRLEAEARRRGIEPERVWVFSPGETRSW
jgi:L-ascorbate metabolism protein UlaG (beta-lactamase superfamily)